MSFSSIGALDDTDADVAKLTTAQQLRNKRLANRLGAENGMNIAGMQHLAAIERKQQVTNQEACFVRGTIGRNVQDNCGCFSLSVGSLREIRRQPNGL